MNEDLLKRMMWSQIMRIFNSGDVYGVENIILIMNKESHDIIHNTDTFEGVEILVDDNQGLMFVVLNKRAYGEYNKKKGKVKKYGRKEKNRESRKDN